MHKAQIHKNSQAAETLSCKWAPALAYEHRTGVFEVSNT